MGLRNRDAVVEVQRAGRCAIESRRDQQAEVLLAELSRRVCGCDAQRQHGTAFDVQRDTREGYVVKMDVSALTADRLQRVPIVVLVVGQVDVDARGVFGCYGGHEDAGAVEILEREGERVGVGGVGEEHGVD